MLTCLFTVFTEGPDFVNLTPPVWWFEQILILHFNDTSQQGHSEEASCVQDPSFECHKLYISASFCWPLENVFQLYISRQLKVTSLHWLLIAQMAFVILNTFIHGFFYNTSFDILFLTFLISLISDISASQLRFLLTVCFNHL